MERTFGDVTLSTVGPVAIVLFSRPPDNYFDAALLGDIADALEVVDRELGIHSAVLASEGRTFCAGAKLGGDQVAVGQVYEQGIRIFSFTKPLVAVVQGAAIGGGLGLALAADFRVVSPRARFSANFVKIGIHPGFGISYTLPRLIGHQKAALLALTGRRLTGEDSVAIGLADELAAEGTERARAIELATELAEAAPLAVQSTRATLRRGLCEAVREQLETETREQIRLLATDDFQEGLRAVSERRAGQWTAR